MVAQSQSHNVRDWDPPCEFTTLPLGGDHIYWLHIDWRNHRISHSRLENVVAFDLLDSQGTAPTQHHISTIYILHHLLLVSYWHHINRNHANPFLFLWIFTTSTHVNVYWRTCYDMTPCTIRLFVSVSQSSLRTRHACTTLSYPTSSTLAHCAQHSLAGVSYFYFSHTTPFVHFEFRAFGDTGGFADWPFRKGHRDDLRVSALCTAWTTIRSL